MEPKANLPSNKYFDNKMDIINIKYKLMLLKKNKQDYVNNYNEMKKLAAFFQYMKLMENFKKEELNAEINRIRYRIKLKNIFMLVHLQSMVEINLYLFHSL